MSSDSDKKLVIWILAIAIVIIISSIREDNWWL